MIDQANPDTLFGIFGDAQWTNKECLSDRTLHDLIEPFGCPEARCYGNQWMSCLPGWMRNL